MGDYCCRIEKMRNGYEVELRDPAIVKANSAPSKKGEYTPYRDPCVSYVFGSVDEVLKFLKKNLEKALPDDEYDSAFDEAAKDGD
jgi:hypothetical protein